jgi:hypothetical protein
MNADAVVQDGIRSNALLSIYFRNFIQDQSFRLSVGKIPSTFDSFMETVVDILKKRGITPPHGIKCASRGRILFRELYPIMFREAIGEQVIIVTPIRDENKIH